MELGFGFSLPTTKINGFENTTLALSCYNAINSIEDGVVYYINGGVVVGLKFHNNLSLNNNGISGGYSMSDFLSFLRQTYNLKMKNVSEVSVEKTNGNVDISSDIMKFMNEEKMVEMMRLDSKWWGQHHKECQTWIKILSIVNCVVQLLGHMGLGIEQGVLGVVGAWLAFYLFLCKASGWNKP